jgi:AraC-like DNA-binding protein
MKRRQTLDYKKSNKVERKSLVSLSVYNCGSQKCPPSYVWGPGVRDHYLIHYIVSGKGTFCAEEQQYPLEAGDCFLARPGQKIWYRADIRDPWEYVWVGFAGADAAAIVTATDFSPEAPVLRALPYGELLREKLLAVSAAYGNTYAHSIAMTGALYSALSVLVAHSHKEDLPMGRDVVLTRRAISFIDGHYALNISVDDIAGFVGLSRSQLFRLFRDNLHTSPKQYLENYRARRACLLLQETDLPIRVISASVGIEDATYFSKLFKKAVGLSPVRYREEHTQSGT